ncbi:hypothetical protein FBU30_007672 [Linnemannia zychae]|nr:hypothetical protein FBU30_007672 [Linnemannia zychae]
MVDHPSSNNKSNSNNVHKESSGIARGSSGMDYSAETSSSEPVHQFSSSSNSSSPSFSSRPLPQHQNHRSQTSTTSSTPAFQHQQLVKIKSEHGLTTPNPQQQQQTNTPDIVMTDEDGDNGEDELVHHDSERPESSPRHPNSEIMEEDEDTEQECAPQHHQYHPSNGQEKVHLMVDTSSSAIHSRTNSPRGGSSAQMSMASPNMTVTPSTATLTPDSGVTSSSSRRPSLRTMTATLPRSALQEETIALFKQYRNLIPCAKCFSRNTIQRDGMSDGNLRFKCRPPVSMSLICNKSYSESKIRNMIAGVVYGHSLPEAGMSSSTTSSENVLAMPLPPNMNKSGPGTGSGRRPSQKHIDPDMTLDPQQSHSFQDNHQDQKGESREQYHDQVRSQYDDNGDDRSGRPGGRRPSSAVPFHPRRPSLIGQESPNMMEYEESTMMGPPSGHLQIPSTPPLDNEDARMYRSHSTYGHRPLTPVGAPSPASSSTSSLAPRRGTPKLHHSQSHPNIGQQRHQQYLDQQRHTQQLQQQPRQVVRIESAQGQGSDFSRLEMAERRFSHPAALQRSPSSKYHSSGPSNAALSPALSSQSSPRYESIQLPVSSSVGSSNRYEETHSQGTPYYQRRMSQPHPSSHRSYGQLPPPPLSNSSHRYDRRASEVEEYNYQHMRQYERLNASTMRSGHPLKVKLSPKQYSPPRSSSALASEAQQRDNPASASSVAYNSGKSGYPPSSSPLLSSNSQELRTLQSEPMRSSHSMSSIEAPSSSVVSGATGSDGGRHAYQTSRQQTSSSVYYHQPSSRDDMEIRDSYAHDNSHGDLPLEDLDGRLYARMRQGSRKPGIGQSIRRLGSSPNLYTSANTTTSPLLSSSSPKDLNSALPRNAIKLTCFPSAVTAATTMDDPNSASAIAGNDDLDMKMSQSSKVVIEITQPRSTFDRSSSSPLSGFEEVPRPLLLSAPSGDVPRHRSLRHTVSQPNLLVRNSSSVLERRRRSVSPPSNSRGNIEGDEEGFGSSKKRRADSLSRDDNSATTTIPSSSSVAEAAAAAVVAAAANAARQNTASGIQIIGNQQDYSKKEIVGLGVVMDHEDGRNSTSGCPSPLIEALDVAKSPSYVSLEDQKELGIDYSLFTRVETAAWRILIPPNVTASFRSEDFGLTLKPKAVSENASPASPTRGSGCADITPLVAPMAAISTSEIEEKVEKKFDNEMSESTSDEKEDERGMDIVMETEEETVTMTIPTVTTAMKTMEATHDDAIIEAQEKEMMDHQSEDN